MSDTHQRPEPGRPAPAPVLPLLAPGHLDAAQRELHARITGGSRARAATVVPVADEQGRLAGPFNALLFAPHVGDAVQELGSRIRYGLSLSDRERELATLLVAGASGSAYELFAHRRLAAAAGLTPAEIERAAGGGLPDLADPREQQITGFCVSLLAGSPSADTVSGAVASLGPQTVVEIVVLVGYYRLLARLLEVAGVGAPSHGT